jgi:dolichol-phosphate mannosyltransferase
MEEPIAPRVLVVIPTYNERENLPRLLEELLALPFNLSVLVVDDNSPDGTGRLAEELSRGEPRLHVLHRPRKMGLGSAYREGFAWALQRDFDRVVEMDADFSHDPRALPRLIAASAETDLVIGSRYVDGGGTAGWGALRRCVSRGGCLYARLILGAPVRDLTGGFKCFRRRVLEAIDLGKVASEGYSFQIEMTYRALKAGFSVKELPILFTDRRGGESKMSWRIFWEAIRKVWWMRWAIR